MGPASDQLSSYPDRASPRRRLIGAIGAIGPTALIVLMLLGLAPAILTPPRQDRPPVLLDLAPDRQATERPTRKAAKSPPAGGGARPTAQPAVKPPATPPAAPVSWPPEMIVLDRDTIAKTDLAMRSAPAAAAGPPGPAKGAGNSDDEGVGTGPNGERLYNAEWYRRPSRAELATYMPPGPPKSGWGLIACRTIADFRVEDCVELAEAPRGAGLSRALRQAAWQFRVRPPRVGGQAMVGAWVRIRFDFNVIETKQ